MFRRIQKRNGSALLLGVMVMMFSIIIISGIMPLVNTQVLNSAVNSNLVEAQYAAEAGAKRAIVGIMKSRTDWTWSLNNTSNPLADGTAGKKYYITSISPSISNGSKPVSGTTYTVTSNGYVNGVSKKVVAVVKSKSGGIFSYALASNGTITISSNSHITGDVYSNGLIDTNGSGEMITGKVYYSGTTPTIEKASNVSGGTPEKVATAVTLDTTTLWPTITKAGSDLSTTWTQGQWGNHTYALSDLVSNSTQSDYYYNSSYNLNGHSYTIASGTSVIIYVAGDFTLMSGSSITGGNLIIYATGNVNFNGGAVSNDSIKVYAGGTINLSSNSSIVNNYGLLFAKGDVNLNGGSAINSIVVSGGTVNANSGSTVAGIYAKTAAKMNGTTVTYNSSVTQSLGLSSGGFTVTWSN